jgi:hypothetical protein
VVPLLPEMEVAELLPCISMELFPLELITVMGTVQVTSTINLFSSLSMLCTNILECSFISSPVSYLYTRQLAKSYSGPAF